MQKFIDEVQKEPYPVLKGYLCAACQRPIEVKQSQQVAQRNRSCQPDKVIFDQETAEQQLQQALENNIKAAKSVTKQDNVSAQHLDSLELEKQLLVKKLQENFILTENQSSMSTLISH